MALLFVYSINFKSIITINYLLNTTEITELFCINKEKPKLQCNGKCHLAKELVKVDKEDSESPFSNQQLSYNLDIVSVLVKQLCELNESESLKVNHTSKNLFNTIDHWYSIPSPPPKA